MAMAESEMSVVRQATLPAKLVAFLALLGGLLGLALLLGDFLRHTVALVTALVGGGLPTGITLLWLGVVVPCYLLGIVLMLTFLRCAGGVFFEESRKWCIALGIVWLVYAALVGAYCLYCMLTSFLMGFPPRVTLWVSVAYAVLGLFYVSPLSLKRRRVGPARAGLS